jgi:hypothetical protein
MVKCFAFFAVWTECLNTIYGIFGFKRLKILCELTKYRRWTDTGSTVATREPFRVIKHDITSM